MPVKEILSMPNFKALSPENINSFPFSHQSKPVISIGELGNIPNKYYLEQNFPNPFNPTTEISYSIPKAGKVKLVVFNSIGEIITELVDTYQDAARYTVSFNAYNSPSGIYYYRIQVDEYSEVKKMVLMK